MTEAFETATSAMQGFSEQLATELNGDWFQETFSVVTTGGSFLIDLIANADKLGVAFSKVGSVITSIFSNTGMLGNVAKIIGTAASGIGTWISGTLMPIITGLFSGIGLSVGWIGAIIAAVVAAIVAIVVYWDDIKYFFTDTLPQLWSQFVEWICGIATKVGDFFSEVISAIGSFFVNCWDAVVSVFTGIGQWMQEYVIQPLIEFITFAIDWIGGKIQEGITAICSAFAGINEFLQGVFAKDWTEQFGAFGNVLNGFFANVENIWNAVKSIFSGIVGFIKSVFAGDWGAAWDSVVGIFKGVWDLLVSIVKAPINGIIGLINGLIQGVVNGINLVIKMLNSISFDVPEWVPGVGGETFGLSLATLQAPQIPYLAQGAVLPANRPFLAVVGDQRHGTNVEAPLETIQEAVAVVIDDYVSAMMAGFEALLAEQRATRQAVESIHIGDDALYKAVQRRSRVMAIARGGL